MNTNLNVESRESRLCSAGSLSVIFTAWESIWVLFFFPFWWKGNYSPLPQQLPQCFRDHSASFRDTHFTYNPSASFRDLVFLVFASATTAPLRFPRFLVVVGFISFRGASAKLPRGFRKIKFQYGTWKLSYIRIYIQIRILPADPLLHLTNIPFRNLPRRTSFREASAAFRGLNPVHFLMNKKLRKLLHKNAKKKRNSYDDCRNWSVSGQLKKNKKHNEPNTSLKLWSWVLNIKQRYRV